MTDASPPQQPEARPDLDEPHEHSFVLQQGATCRCGVTRTPKRQPYTDILAEALCRNEHDPMVQTMPDSTGPLACFRHRGEAASAFRAPSVPLPVDGLDPLAALRELVGVLERHPEAHRLDSSLGRHEYVVAVLRARAAVRAASQKGTDPDLIDMDVDTLASIIREVDGDHNLGAGALAKAIRARLQSEPTDKGDRQ